MQNQPISPEPTPPAQSANATRRPMRVGFLSMTALIDPASGASQSILTMLRALAERGVQCHALSGTCFDSPHGQQLPAFLEGQGLTPGALRQGGPLVWRGSVQGVAVHMMHVQSQHRMTATAIEELNFRDLAESWLRQTKPDVIIAFGGFVLDMELMRQAQRHGAAVVFYLANGNYARLQTFEPVDLVITNSASTAALYRSRLQLTAHNVGLFVDSRPQESPLADRRYVTFVNPQPEKGVTLFLALLQRAARECPDMRFLVVESRAELLPAIRKLGLPEQLLDKVERVPRQTSLKPIYAQTRILLMPSFWFEAAGRVLIEATSNGIPVIAANRGGIPETLAGGGVVLDIPEACIKDHWQVPDERTVDAWWSHLKRLWEDADAYAHACTTASTAARSHALDVKVQRLLTLLHAALANRNRRIERLAQMSHG
ncbi:glycosyltransferase family 4 protein [Burkholderia guangdongensis]|uniref:glycosyltransferase family 4 protein n=1 Tax=Burkholderia guangdongensis TaxID=1792500 RepID=UPI0015CB5E69|nr:glycosyltransferase family 4 protein [Burkholderia guangdongensis]